VEIVRWSVGVGMAAEAPENFRENEISVPRSPTVNAMLKEFPDSVSKNIDCGAEYPTAIISP